MAVSGAAAASAHSLVAGRYRALRPLGSGGSGSVWLARDEQTGLDVALKIIPREGNAADRAEREAAAAARLRHPACLRAYAFHRDGGHVYIAYEYVPGWTLREAIRGGAVDDRTAVEVAAQVLEALAHAHARGIVHRDVKPSNILLAAGDGVSVRLLDFGLARIAEAETLTAAGDVPGTLAYISPERLRGDDSTAAADVWAVGVLLWEALAGWHPFWASSLVETSRKIAAGAPPLADARPDLPETLRAAVDSALTLDPARRPPAGKLAADLRSVRRRRAPAAAAAKDGTARRRLSLPALAARSAPAALAGVTAGWVTATLPFYPPGWYAGIAGAVAGATFLHARGGLALALAVPFFPLANLALGAALLYSAVAVAWLALSWREPRAGLVAALGPLLAPVSALGLLPLAAAQAVRGHARRTLQVAAAVLLAAVVAGLRRVPLPFVGGDPPGVAIAGSERPAEVARALADAVSAHPVLALEAAALAVLALALPFARGRGAWPVAGWGAAFLALTLLPAPEIDPLPLVLAAWITCVTIVLLDRRNALPRN